MSKPMTKSSSVEVETRPEVVRVFGRNYYLIYASAEHGMTELGLCHPNEGLINIQNGQLPIEEKDTILHEVMHVIDHVMESGLEEKQITTLAHGLIGVFQDNPEFAKFIIEKVTT